MEKKRVDLHTHSIYSDGCNTPQEILEKARKKNITTLAITDHDNIEGSKELIRIGTGKIRVYSGVELTIKVKKGRFHLLGYNIDLENEQLNKELKEIKETSIYNTLLYIEKLKQEFGIPIPKEEIDNLLKIKGNIGRPQIAHILIKLGYCSTVKEAFDRYLITVYEKSRRKKKGISAEEGIDLIKNAGGEPIIAHPNSLKLKNQELDQYVKYLKEHGLSGLETIHINESNEERKFYHELAQKYDLLETGGTDFHGITVKPDVELGYGRNHNVEIEENTLSFTQKIKSRYQ